MIFRSSSVILWRMALFAYPYSQYIQYVRWSPLFFYHKHDDYRDSRNKS